ISWNDEGTADLVRGSLNLQLLHPATQSVGVESEPLRGPMRPVYDPAAVQQDSTDMSTIDILKLGDRFRAPVDTPVAALRRGHEVDDLNDPFARLNGSAFYYVEQFSHITRPLVSHEEIERTWIHGCQRLAEGPGETGDEKLYKQRNVRATLAQRRHDDGKHVETVIQIRAERAGADCLLQIAVGGGNHANVDLGLLGAAHALELAALQNSQELRLHFQGKISNFVQEDCRAGGKLESALLAGHRTGEGALLVAEQFGLDDAGGQGGAVHGNQRFVLQRTGLVHGPGNQLLSGSGFAENEDCRPGLRNGRDILNDLSNPRALSEQTSAMLPGLDDLAELHVLPFQLRLQAPELLFGALPLGDVFLYDDVVADPSRLVVNSGNGNQIGRAS